MQRLGVYIHWPFCLSKCPYCDFFSQVRRDISQETLIEQYLSDLDFYRSINDDYQVDSIFFGGGTPSLINPANVAKIIDKISELWECSDSLEISLEANPNSNNKTLFSDLRQAGINRLSLGVQALNDTDLQFLGRTHDLKSAYSAIDSVVNTFDNHSIDLIYARPSQKADDWEKELQIATGLGFNHLSLYQLTIEENTAFGKMGVKPMEDEPAIELYELSGDILRQNGYTQYEISNYVKMGRECRHNLGYWQGEDYVGVGQGAVGYIRSNGKIYTTVHSRKMEEVTAKERAEELIIMGLRLNEGINLVHFQERCGLDFFEIINGKEFEYFKFEKMIEEKNEFIAVTDKGRPLLNYIIKRLCL